MSTASILSQEKRLAAITVAHAAGAITDHSARTMQDWLTQPRYAGFAEELATRIDRTAAEPAIWKELDDVYWTVIPFGTGGRRGKMYPVGSNAINDCDRLGAAAALTHAPDSPWETFTGNQIAALLVDWVFSCRQASGRLLPTDHLITTLVTTGLVRRIADAYRATTVDTLQVGFKWIGQAIDQIGPEQFVFGCEESHGYLAGTHVRDKDASVAALLFAELAAALKAQGKTVHEQLNTLFCTFGCHQERQVAITLPGAAGMDRMREIMATLRGQPPKTLGGLNVVRVRDYLGLTTSTPGSAAVAFTGAAGDLVMFDCSSGPGLVAATDPAAVAAGWFPPLANCVAARPSGTEPKIKFYLFTVAPPCRSQDLANVKQQLTVRLDALERDLRSLAGV